MIFLTAFYINFTVKIFVFSFILWDFFLFSGAPEPAYRSPGSLGSRPLRSCAASHKRSAGNTRGQVRA